MSDTYLRSIFDFDENLAILQFGDWDLLDGTLASLPSVVSLKDGFASQTHRINSESFECLWDTHDD